LFFVCQQKTWWTFELKSFVIDINVNAVSAERSNFTFSANDKESPIPTATAPLLNHFSKD